jgi:hypothetical protein
METKKLKPAGIAEVDLAFVAMDKEAADEFSAAIARSS